MKRHIIVLACSVIATAAGPAFALPTMIRLGYRECAACHISPQGGGLLNEYGRAIDEAQSRRAGEYRPSESSILKALAWGGRVTQDVRVVVQDQRAWAGRSQTSQVLWPRIVYRNVTGVGSQFKVAATITGQTASAPRPSVRYDPGAGPSTVFVNTALVHYEATKTLAFAAGRDQLPTGINIPDLGAFIKSRSRLGYDEAPTQVKMFWNGPRWYVSPFVFGPGGHEAAGEGESGAGTLAELDILGRLKTVVGMSLVRGSAQHFDRDTIGAYARLGFGKWGILAEHDVTSRVRDAQAPASFQQHATYGQVFWAMQEWLVVSATGERLRVEAPFEARVTAGKLELAARLTNQVSLGVSGRVQHDALTKRVSTSATFQFALKSPQ